MDVYLDRNKVISQKLAATAPTDVYFDSNKDISPKLAATGSPMEEEDIVCHTLHSP